MSRISPSAMLAISFAQGENPENSLKVKTRPKVNQSKAAIFFPAMGSMGKCAFLALAALHGFLASETCDTVEMLQAQATLRAKGDTSDEEELKLVL